MAKTQIEQTPFDLEYIEKPTTPKEMCTLWADLGPGFGWQPIGKVKSIGQSPKPSDALRGVQ